MVRLAIEDNALFELDERECRQTTPSYTVDTLSALRAEWGKQRAICLLIGTDAFVALTTWKQWEKLFDLAHLVVAYRPGVALDTLAEQLPPALRAAYEARRTSDPRVLQSQPAGYVLPIASTALDISATAIRGLIAQGRSPRYLLPRAVIAYIEGHQLYRTLHEEG
jgi:nicotinate-nucleotide adenylyltransferase